MKTVPAFLVLAIMGCAYLYWVRPYLKALPSLHALWTKEDSLWAAFKEWLDGRKTIIIGFWGEIIAFAPDILQEVGALDFKTLGLPDHWAAWVNAFIPVLMMVFRVQGKIEKS